MNNTLIEKKIEELLILAEKEKDESTLTILSILLKAKKNGSDKIFSDLILDVQKNVLSHIDNFLHKGSN